MAKLTGILKKFKNGAYSDYKERLIWLYHYARKYWKMVVIYTLLGLTGAGVSLITSLISRDMVDIVTGYQTGVVLQTFCLMIGMTLGNTLITQVSNYISEKINLKVNSEIKSDFFSQILVTDWEALSEYHTGDLLARWNTDSGAVSNGVLNIVPNTIVNFVRFVSAFVVMVANDWSFAAIALISAPFTLLISKMMMKKITENSMSTMELNAKISGFNQETFSNIQTIKAFSLVPEYIGRFHQIQGEYIKTRLKYQRNYIWLALLNVLLSLVVSYASYGWGIYKVWSNAITYGSLTMLMSMASSLSSTLNALISTVPMSMNVLISAGRMMEIVSLPKEDYGNDAEVDAFMQKNINTGVSLEMKNIDFSYRNGTEVFRGADLVARPHEVVALVGPSGEGKTTMLRLILALVVKSKGTSELYGEGSNNSIELNAAARKLFSYVPQGNTMFSGTIAENMRFVKKDATDEEIMEALEMACAKEFVEKMPKGIYSELKERGGGISEGQAQRLSIARALLRKSPILLLDEATSALDIATEKKVLSRIMKDTYPRTCIVTTHRPTVLNSCNRVYRIDEMSCRIMSDEEIAALRNA